MQESDGALETSPLALLLTGGGARAAYQVGALQALAEMRPELDVSILTGVSAGGINVASLASSAGDFRDATRALADLWLSLSPERVFEVDAWSLAQGVGRWVVRLGSGGSELAPMTRGLVGTGPLRDLLTNALENEDGVLMGIERKIRAGRLRAVAVSTVDYASGRTIVWTQGRDIEAWERPQRQSVRTRLRIEHIMASAALPLLFPAIYLDGSWYGDGGVRLTSPLSPPIHLGARRILAISTRYRRSPAEARLPVIDGYPPPAQVAGVLLNAIFLDLLDQDALHCERTNRLISHLPPDEREGLHPIDLLILRPSRDLGLLASEYESRLPGAFRFLTRGLGTRETRSSDLLSLLMFQHDYLSRLMELGRADVEEQREEILALVDAEAVAA